MDFQHLTCIMSSKIINGTFCIKSSKQDKITSTCFQWKEYAGKVYIHYQKSRLQDYMHYMRYNLSFPVTMILRTYTFVTIYLPVHRYPHYIRYRMNFQQFTFYKFFQNQKRPFSIRGSKQYIITSMCF